MLFKGYTTVQIRSTLVAKVGIAHAQQDCLNAKFQVLVQINKVLLCTIKGKQTRNKQQKIPKGSRDHN